ncbi:SPOR domain-containing protein [Sphingomonas solaris]|uniref:SPOR domain-containing protein n=1 Tax=Alterirhizorhabdus solaris TaxID=2529389 RepID=A0A558QTA0_9SPHN|nr:SPOR domain-containing protein [Sphingomonas solaris]TVV70344.1 hypothetical protein FOY91_19330 [Sphingomonas solaris]
MTSHSPTLRARLARLLASFALIAPLAMPPLAAQTTGYPALADADPVTALSRYLRMLAANPRDLASLTGAGRAALAVGDANAALGFYARAEELAPRNGRIKAGLATALVQMEQPRAALKLFDEAVALGVPAGEIAADRGLANDLNGDGRRAQADYTIALRAREDAETVRRLALSMAVSGDRDGALAVLSPLLRRRDSGAERARAFVLALTGDQTGAANAVRAAMPGPQATVMTSFMSRLARLNPAQKALAVNFGYFPSDGRSYTAAELFADARAASLPAVGSAIGQRDPRRDLRGDTPLIPAGEALGPRIARNDVVSVAPRRRPGEMAEVMPPPHVLSAPIPGVTPLTTAMGVAETRVALAQSGGVASRPVAAIPAARQDGGIVAAAGGPVVATRTTPPTTIRTVTGPVVSATAAAGATAAAPVAASVAVPTGSAPAVTAVAVPASASAVPSPGFDVLQATPAATAEASRPAAPVATALSANAPVVVTATGPALATAPSPVPARVAAAPRTTMPPAVRATETSPTRQSQSAVRTTTRTERLAKATAAREDRESTDEMPAVAGRKSGATTRNGKPVKLAALDPKAGKSPRSGESGVRTGKAGEAAEDSATEDVTTGRNAKSKGTQAARTTKAAKASGKAADAGADDGANDTKTGKTGKSTRDARSSGKARIAEDVKTDRESKIDADAKTGKSAKTDKDTKAGRNAKAGKDMEIAGNAQPAKDAKTTKGAKAADTKARPATAERYWVQVASGSNKANLDKAWDSVKGKAPKLLAGQTTHTAPWKASNRLLIGPFKSEADAQAKVNALAKAGVSGIQFTTRAGADVEKVGGGK